MANTKPKGAKSSPFGNNARFEYRVWGRHSKARKMLRTMAENEVTEHFDDCYLLVDDPAFNAKVRNNTLKVKELVNNRKGFEHWVSERHNAVETVPSPFDDLYENLKLHKLGKKGFDLQKAVKKLGPHSGVRAMVVTKDRRRYFVDSLKAEVTDIEIHDTGEVLRTLSIEGDDLDQLVKLRKKLGLKGETNTPVHQAIDPTVDTDL